MTPKTPLLLLLAAPALSQDEVRITEYMYKGLSGEFLEITNVGASAVDLTGWSLDDVDAVPGTLDLSSLGVLAPGESAVITEADSSMFAAAWGLVGVKILGGNFAANLKRNDAIHLFGASLLEHDTLEYGDEDFPGSLRTDAISAFACDEVLGEDFVFGWLESVAGDAHGSVASAQGDVGSPGSHVAVECDIYAYCTAEDNSTGEPAEIFASGSFDLLDNAMLLTASALPIDQFGYFLCSQTQAFVALPPGSEGNLCLGGTIGRFVNDVQNSGLVGEISIAIDLTALPLSPAHAVVPGETWNFTAWYRDLNPAATSNFTNAVSVTFD